MSINLQGNLILGPFLPENAVLAQFHLAMGKIIKADQFTKSSFLYDVLGGLYILDFCKNFKTTICGNTFWRHFMHLPALFEMLVIYGIFIIMCCQFGYCVFQYGLWSFQTRGTKLERFLPKNQHPQRKLLNFDNWISGGLRSFQKSEF